MLVMARWMRDAGHRVEVAVPVGSRSWLQGLEWGLPLSPAPDVSSGTLKGHASTWTRGKRFDVLWIRDRRDLAFSGRAARSLGAALVMQQAMQIPRAKNAPWQWLRYRRVDTWVCGLQHLKAECLARTPIDEARCHVLPLPLDDRWFAPAEASSAFREALELPEGAWLLGTVGRLDPKKGQRTALQALARLPEHVHWLFVGDNTVDNERDEREVLVERAHSLGVESRAHFLDARADVLPVYDALDAFVMSSDSETIGTVTLEALAREVPVIGTDAGGTSELLDDGRGLLVPPRNAEAMAEAVTVLMKESPEALANRMRRGRDYAAKCRPAQLIPAWEELLASLVESRRKA